MAITHFLLQSNFNSNTFIQQSFPTKWSCSAHLTRNHSCYNVIKASPQMRIKCFTMNHHKTMHGENSNEFRKVDTGCHINEVISRLVENVLKAFQKPVITGVMLLLGLIFCYDQQRHAMAASGGRMGGRSFSSSRSSSRSSRSSSSSSRSSSRSSRSSSSSSRSYSSPRSSSSSIYSSTRTSSPESSSSENYSTQVGSPVPSKEKQKKLKWLIDVCFIITFVSIIFLIAYWLPRSDSVQDTAKSSVIKLQVGLLGTARSLQKDLNQIAETADTSSPKGLSYVLQETTAALLRHPDYCISSYSSVDVKRGAKETEKGFNKLSIEERNKFDEETLVNVDNIRKQTASTPISNGACSEYIVVTIIVASRGIHELPPVKSIAELKKALQKLASISSSNIMAAEVLWTPQKENDCLSEKEMLEDYPLLQPL